VFNFQYYPVVFHWNQNLSTYYTSVQLIDETGGAIVNIDMLHTDSLKLPAQTISSFLIYATGPKGLIADVSSRSEMPHEFQLMQNYPNPFNPTTTVSFVISHLSFVSLKVFDLLGREVRTLVNGMKPAGRYDVKFDAGTLPSGIYVCALTAGDVHFTRKMVLSK
jgi:hypothetical protein